MYQVLIERRFTAGHALRLAGGQCEPRHSHDWQVEVCVESPRLDEQDLVVDFHRLERQVDAVLAGLEGACLNDLEQFAQVNPSAERVARYLHDALAPQLAAPVRLAWVRVTEAPGCRALYRPDD